MLELREPDHQAIRGHATLGGAEFADLGSKPVRYLAAAAILIALASFATMILFVGPAWDDFYHAVAIRDESWQGYVQRIFMTWTGRWAGVGLAAAVLSSMDLVRDYPIAIGILVVVQGIGIALLWRMLLGDSGTRWTRLVLTLTTLATLWANMPVLNQTLYWFSGAVVYQLPITLSLFLVAGLVSIARTKGKSWRHWLAVAGLAGLALGITGLHELCALSLCVALAAGTVLAWRNRAARMAWLVVLGTALVGTLITVAAPGNFERAKSLVDPPQQTPLPGTIAERLAGASARAIRAVANVGPTWLLDAKLLAIAALFSCNPYLGTLYPGWLKGRERLWKWLTLGGFAPLLAGWFLLPSLVGVLPWRTLGGAYFIFFIGWIVTVFVWTRKPDTARAALAASTGKLQSAALLVFAASLLLTGNARLALADLSYQRPQAYRTAIRERESLIHRAIEAGQRDVRVPTIPNQCFLIYFVDITEDEKHWCNRAVAQYYGLRSLRLDPHAKQARTGAGQRMSATEAVDAKP